MVIAQIVSYPSTTTYFSTNSSINSSTKKSISTSAEPFLLFVFCLIGFCIFIAFFGILCFWGGGMSLQYCVTGSETHLHLITLFASISSFCDVITKIDIFLMLGTVLFNIKNITQSEKSSKSFASHLSPV